ncbi:DNA mismatch endonuclease Vsr [Mesorhizobium sp. M0767]
MMAGIKAKDTKPELVIRRRLHALGFRYRLHPKDVPGKPDIVLPKFDAAIFVHGCFWHGHDCPLFRMPDTRREFWQTKISRNCTRDIEVSRLLCEFGWRQLTIWECAFRGPGQIGVDAVIERVTAWLLSNSVVDEIRSVHEGFAT